MLLCFGPRLRCFYFDPNVDVCAKVNLQNCLEFLVVFCWFTFHGYRFFSIPRFSIVSFTASAMKVVLLSVMMVFRTCV